MKLVHLVYVHGFQGNDTTFQSFPSDLQQYLSTHIPAHLDIRINSSIYPTYKSVKPISAATSNFLEWLSTQPPGPVILLGHSMGGLLVADAATGISNNPNRYPGSKPKRIVGMIAFDTPYLGMHPHVVVTGIASLFPKGEHGDKTEGEMNDHPGVNIVNGKVTEDWDAFKQNLPDNQSMSTASSSGPRPPPLPPRPSSSSIPPPRPSSTLSPPRSPSPSMSWSPSPLINRAFTFVNSHADDPLVKWVRKHSDHPLSAGQRWIVERFQFGICMFDPIGLKERYTRLVAWQGGRWINYWTQTVPKPRVGGIKEGEKNTEEPDEEQIADNDAALLETGVASVDAASIPSQSSPPAAQSSPPSSSSPDTPIHGAPTKSEMEAAQKAEEKAQKAQEKERKQAERTLEKELKRLQKQREADAKLSSKAEKEKGKMKPGRHFVVLPTGLGQVLGGGDNWEKVLIGGVEDEVAAHCGLFIRGQNLDYDGLVERVAARVLGWCEGL